MIRQLQMQLTALILIKDWTPPAPTPTPPDPLVPPDPAYPLIPPDNNSPIPLITPTPAYPLITPSCTDIQCIIDNGTSSDSGGQYDTNGINNDDDGINLADFGISKESLEITVAGLIPVLLTKRTSIIVPYVVLSPGIAVAITYATGEPTDEYNFGDWNAAVQSKVGWVTEIVDDTKYVIANVETPLEFIQKHNVATTLALGLTATSVVTAGLYKSKILPDSALGYVFLGGLTLTAGAAALQEVESLWDSAKKVFNPANWF
jgi:hypothetical protein